MQILIYCYKEITGVCFTPFYIPISLKTTNAPRKPMPKECKIKPI